MTTLDLTKALEHYFGFRQFREGQEEVIRDILAGENVLGILPTGTGKSLCYQLPAKLLGGTAIVVSPLISLMIDQVKQLKAAGYKDVTALNSFMDRQEKIRTLERLSDFSLVYISPEMLQNERLKERLDSTNVTLFVIDEAHCISQWGHEFRTDYMKLHRTIEEIGNPPVLALSATATPEVQQDIMDKLNLPNMKKRIFPMDKQNISLAVESYEKPDDKVDRIVGLLNSNHAPTMIYFSSRQWAERVSVELRQRVDKRVAFYHGGMDQTDRMLVQQQFMNDQLDVICCTSAFGMGVDKGNIRLVIHFHLPSQLESFIQEIGRAGRDGEASVSLVLHTPRDHHLPQLLIQGELPTEADIERVLHSSNRPVSVEDTLMMEAYQLSESQWNFIKYHLEENGWMNNQRISDVPSSFHLELKRILRQRLEYKHYKLKEMLSWLHVTGCRRESLYRPFQSGYREPNVPCCDNCGFHIDSVRFNVNSRVLGAGSWLDRLKSVFQIEASHES
ncbi:ATP-dependent DNA helicase RecQ [Bacillus sp. SB49]|uniref:RecQ family ATP-dependent DNA helicase n=1 Tax=Bacillaceae TaxID=186817 RepID=UPI0002A4F9E9|nr:MULTISPECIES: RecQ family ATP-dependent DNA helicase [Bacillaceae]ELK45372.1 ATP-dependent DNA helicase RecS [Halobacillus sp. BAB-2008]QHT46903.1 ATP-dependent DNA helicase RecQ [Bacillus sp. SB49]